MELWLKKTEMISIILSMRSNRSKFGGRGFFGTLVFFTNDLLGVPIEIVFLSILQLQWEPLVNP